MVKKINNRLYKVNTYASAHIIEVDDNYDEEVQKLRKEIQLDSIGYKLNLLAYLATLTVQGYAILSVTEFNIDGSKPRVAYASSKDFKKIVKYYFKKKAQETEIYSEERQVKFMDRKEYLLRQVLKLFKQQKESRYVLNIEEMTVMYDGAECDGSCLCDDIMEELGIDSLEDIEDEK